MQKTRKKKRNRKKPSDIDYVISEEYAKQGWEIVANIKGIQNPDKLYTVMRKKVRRKIEWHCTCSAPEPVWCYHKQEASKLYRKRNRKPETKIVY